MMKDFPTIDLQKVRSAIAGRTEFIEANRGDHIIFNYNFVLPDSFDCEIRRECRGLVFSPEGKVLSRRFHKFFNMGEREETSVSSIFAKMNNVQHKILEKLDGSMIAPIPFNDGKNIRWGTKMGLTEISSMVEEYIKNNANRKYNVFAKDCYSCDITPIFEYIGPKNRVVIKYDQEDLILVAIRHNVYGRYMSYEMVKMMGEEYNIPVVPVLYIDFKKVHESLNYEGVVVSFDDGHKVKIKTDWYVHLHNAKDDMMNEKNMIHLILNDTVDDLIPLLEPEDVNKIVEYTNDLNYSIVVQARFIQNLIVSLRNSGIDRKTFALTQAKKLNSVVSSIVFKNWDKDVPSLVDIRSFLVEYALKNTKTKNDVEELRKWFQFKTWV